MDCEALARSVFNEWLSIMREWVFPLRRRLACKREARIFDKVQVTRSFSRSLKIKRLRAGNSSKLGASRKHIINLRWLKGLEHGFDSALIAKLIDAPEVKMSRRQSQKFKEMTSM
jgi:hypothetical protein